MFANPPNPLPEAPLPAAPEKKLIIENIIKDVSSLLRAEITGNRSGSTTFA